MVGNKDDPRVVVNALLSQVIEPLAQPLVAGNIRQIASLRVHDLARDVVELKIPSR